MINSDNIINSINLDSRDQNGNTILQQAILENNIDIIALILNKIENSADKFKILNAQNNDGDTAFFLAVKNNMGMIAQMLDYSGADKSIKNNQGEFVIDDTNDPHSETSEPEMILEDSEIVNFEFPVVRCPNNIEMEEDPIDMSEIVFAISQIGKNKQLPVIDFEATEINNEDVYLARLAEKYLERKNNKLQMGGGKKKIIKGKEEYNKNN